MNHRTGELGQVAETQPGRRGGVADRRTRKRNFKQSMGERLVISETSTISTFKHEPEMTERRVGSQELMAKVGVFLLGVGELLGVESQQSPGTIQELL